MNNQIEPAHAPARRSGGFGWLVAFLAIVGAIVFIPALLHAILALIGLAVGLVAAVFASLLAAGVVVSALVLVGLPFLILIGIGYLVGRSRRKD